MRAAIHQRSLAQDFSGSAGCSAIKKKSGQNVAAGDSGAALGAAEVIAVALLAAEAATGTSGSRGGSGESGGSTGGCKDIGGN